MARMLGRSRSMKMLRGFYKEPHQKEQHDVAPSFADSEVHPERIKPITHAATVDVRVETPDLAHRPRTAGGPAERGRLFHKKVAPAAPDTEIRAFDFPLPSSSATTVLYAAEVHEVKEEGIIGIALGSPTMASHWSSSPHNTDYVTSGHGTTTHISSPNSSVNSPKHDISKPKLGRWRSIFGRKSSPRHQPQEPPKSTPFYQLQRSPAPASVAPSSVERVDSHHEDDHLDLRSTSRQDDSPVNLVLFKPEIRESRKTMIIPPKIPEQEPPKPKTNRDTAYGLPRPSLKRQDTGSSATSFLPPKPKAPSPTVPTVVVTSGPQSTSPRPVLDKPVLDVEIPQIKMERYSVMFGSLLQQQSNRSSSLLVRRQGNQDKLKPLNELSLKVEEESSHMKPQRRATSPSMPKSPISLSLFPQPGRSNPTPARISNRQSRLLQRSRTAPSISPSKQFFEVSKEPSKSSNLTVEDDPGMKTLMLPPTPSSFTSFASSVEEIEIGVQAWESKAGEPKWEIVSKSTTNLVSQSHSASPNSDHDSDHQNLKVAPLNIRASDKKSNAGTGAAPVTATTSERSQSRTQETVGIARSVSVSRAQGIVRADVVARSPVMGLSRSVTSPLMMQVGGERFGERKPLTPTFVEIRNRRSQRVQILEA